jgi:Ca-activated chloride channel family protein
MVAKNDFDADDARLSAYALGELDASERAEVERLLAGNEEARKFVDELRATATALERELADEALPELSATQRAQIAAAPRQRAVPIRAAVALASALAASIAVIVFVIAQKKSEQRAFLAYGARRPAPAASDPLRALGYLGDGSAPTSPVVVSNNSVPPPTGVVLDELGRVSATARLSAEHLKGMRPSHAMYQELERQLAEEGRFNTEAYASIIENVFKLSRDEALSTFSIDVDTASYANVRRFLMSEGRMPPAGAVRIEELINYFRYDYPQARGAEPFSVTTDVATCPWTRDHLLVRIGLRGREVHVQERPASNLVFLIDVSGSMNQPDKLPLLVRSLGMLVEQLDARDRIAMVVYAGSSGLVLDSTSGSNKGAITAALEGLQAGGSTNGGEGIELAYKTAREHFVQEGTNRVILCTDGDFNVGTTSESDLVALIERERASGVFLSVLGFGTGNLQDSKMEQLADKGNGNYGYIDSLNEARKVLVDELGGTLITIAKDVKIQVEFNPAAVQAWRQIGYENRALAHQDFDDDHKDAGEIGAGHTVTALYELVPVGVAFSAPSVDAPRYQGPSETPASAFRDELMFVKLRYKEPEGDTSKLLSTPVRNESVEFENASQDFRFAASVAAFGMKLRNSAHVADLPFEWLYNSVMKSMGPDVNGYRREFAGMVERAGKLHVR